MLPALAYIDVLASSSSETLVLFSFNGKPAVESRNDAIVVTVLMGGGHIAAVRVPGRDINPLWVPEWPTTTPGLRRIVAWETFLRRKRTG